MYFSLTFIMVFAVLIGLCVGSFLNVLIYRLPVMLEAEFEGKESPLSLSHPPSRCGHCGHGIRWYENIPILSFLYLRGRCSACGKPIGWRYPLVELLTALIFAYCAWRWGASLTAAAYAVCGTALLALAAIDWDTTLLPDDITQPVLWLGLIAAACQLLPGLSIQQSLAGAVLGYMFLWLVYWTFKLITGREGMGYGDFKLFALIGAWLGWSALLSVILVASVLGSVVGIAQKLRKTEREDGYVPFGPFLAFAAMLQCVTGWQL